MSVVGDAGTPEPASLAEQLVAAFREAERINDRDTELVQLRSLLARLSAAIEDHFAHPVMDFTPQTPDHAHRWCELTAARIAALRAVGKDTDQP